jgi:hypothetical protein
MRRPQDPRNHGLKEPKQVHSQRETLVLSDDSEPMGNGKLSLEAIIGAWNHALKDHLSQGHRITDGPYVEGDSYRLFLTYTYEWDNFNYTVEKAEFDLTMANYLAELNHYKEVEEGKKNGPPPNIDEKIARAEQRLANLKAAKAGEPLPHPESQY